MNWWKGLKGEIKLKEPLKKHTTFKIGGPADFFIEPKDPADLKNLLKSAGRHKIPLSLIGSGSNILASDAGKKGAVIRFNSPYFRKVSLRGNLLEAGSGVSLNQVLLLSRKKGLSGLEYLSGIPGTVGGALAMNAGVAAGCIADRVRDVVVMDYSGNVKVFPRRKIKSGYRRCSLDRYIILSARFELAKDKKEEVRDRINSCIKLRRAAQDLSLPSAGCVFKNPANNSAGRLIDLCGLKGKTIGGARVSLKHANFIVNERNARCADVLKLMQLIRKRVKNKFKVDLKPEIKIWH